MGPSLPGHAACLRILLVGTVTADRQAALGALPGAERRSPSPARRGRAVGVELAVASTAGWPAGRGVNADSRLPVTLISGALGWVLPFLAYR